jgi:hypothetical protein
MQRREAIAEAILASKALLTRYLPGFDDTNHTRQAPGLPNHVAWCLGHLALTTHRIAEKLDGGPIPASDFIIGDLTKPPADPARPSGDASRYHTETVAFASVPTDNPARYPRFARCIDIYNAACDRLAAAVGTVPEARLDEVIPWGTSQIPLYLAAARMLFHNGMHTGQIADLRRALGFKSIFA